jgi:hypothetical protein
MVRGAIPAYSRTASEIQYRDQELSPNIQPSKRATEVRRWPAFYDLYWTWSYPREANRDVTELDNRFFNHN